MSAPDWRRRSIGDDRRAVNLPRPLLEGADHAADRLVEHNPDRRLQDAAAELEVHEEVHLAALRVGQELPLVVQVAERAGFVAHFRPLWPLQRNAAREGFAKRAEADSEVGNQFALGAAAHARGDAPGEELRVFADIGHQIEQLVGPVWDDLALGVGGHQAEASFASRAARSEEKSASAW